MATVTAAITDGSDITFTQALTELVDDGYLDTSEAVGIARRILHENAMALLRAHCVPRLRDRLAPRPHSGIGRTCAGDVR
jgi:hypothetical protein